MGAKCTANLDSPLMGSNEPFKPMLNDNPVLLCITWYDERETGELFFSLIYILYPGQLLTT